MYGTTFQQQVWNQLENIPYGETRTYKELAEALGCPQSVRSIATAIGRNPLLVLIPCHRVIGSDGTLRGYRGGLEMKEQLLLLEKDNNAI